MKKIIKYLKETQNYGLCHQSSNSNILQAYSDADYGKDMCTRRPLTKYIFINNGAAVTWVTLNVNRVLLYPLRSFVVKKTIN